MDALKASADRTGHYDPLIFLQLAGVHQMHDFAGYSQSPFHPFSESAVRLAQQDGRIVQLLHYMTEVNMHHGLAGSMSVLQKSFCSFVRACFTMFRRGAMVLTGELRTKIALAHCESLLGFFTDELSASNEPLAFLASLLAEFVEQLCLENDSVPVAALQRCIQFLVLAAVRNRMTSDVREVVYRALSRILQKLMPPDPPSKEETEPKEETAPKEETVAFSVEATMNTPELTCLVHVCLKDAATMPNARDLLSQLATHMPKTIATLFELPQTWVHFKVALARFFDNPANPFGQFVAQILAEFSTALRFFENGCLEDLLAMDLRSLPVAAFAPEGQVIEIPEPALLNALLQVLTVLVATLPKHLMVLKRVSIWIEFYHKLIFDILSSMSPPEIVQKPGSTYHVGARTLELLCVIAGTNQKERSSCAFLDAQSPLTHRLVPIIEMSTRAMEKETTESRSLRRHVLKVSLQLLTYECTARAKEDLTAPHHHHPVGRGDLADHNTLKKLKVVIRVFRLVVCATEDDDANKDHVIEVCLYLLFVYLSDLGYQAASFVRSLPALLTPLKSETRRLKSPFMSVLAEKVDHIIRTFVTDVVL